MRTCILLSFLSIAALLPAKDVTPIPPAPKPAVVPAKVPTPAKSVAPVTKSVPTKLPDAKISDTKGPKPEGNEVLQLPEGAIMPGFRSEVVTKEKPAETPNVFITEPLTEIQPVSNELVDSLAKRITGVIVRTDSRPVLLVDNVPVFVGELIPAKAPEKEKARGDVKGRVESRPEAKKPAVSSEAVGGLRLINLSRDQAIVSNGGTTITVPLSLTRQAVTEGKVPYTITSLTANGFIFTNRGHILTDYQHVKEAQALEVGTPRDNLSGALVYTPGERGGTDLNFAVMTASMDGGMRIPQDDTFTSGTAYFVSFISPEGDRTPSIGLYKIQAESNQGNPTILMLQTSLPDTFAGTPVFTPQGRLIGILTNPIGTDRIDRILRASELYRILAAQDPSIGRAIQDTPVMTDPKLPNLIARVVRVSTQTRQTAVSTVDTPKGLRTTVGENSNAAIEATIDPVSKQQ